MRFEKIDKETLRTFLSTCSPATKVYLGVDSERVKLKGVWYADYISVVVVHINGKNGCRLFYQVEREPDYDKRKDRPTFRLMNEVYKLGSLYLDLEDVFKNFETEVHLDINTDKRAVSNHVITQACGYIRGVCGFEPKCKPDAWAATHAADHAKRIQYYHVAREIAVQ